MLDSTAASLARSLAAVMRGHLYPGSEGDAPYRPFAAPLPINRLDARTFRTAASVPRGWDVQFGDAKSWLADQATPQLDRFSDPVDAEAEAEAYQVLTTLMDTTMGRRLHRAAAVPPLGRMATFHYTRRYFVGRFGGTHVVGLVAFSVET